MKNCVEILVTNSQDERNTIRA